MSIDRDDVVNRAIAWHVRRDKMNDADWRAFIIWLELSPSHADAYDAIALQDRLPLRIEAPVAAANDNIKRSWWAIGFGMAAIAAVAVGVVAIPRSAPYSITTKAGEQRVIALADGTRIEVNGATSLTLDHHNQRLATLERGEATFHVRHDASDPFTLHTGERVIEDAGTVFNVSREGQRLDVQVAEGAIIFEPGKQAITLRPGGALTVNEDSVSLAVSRVAVESVGAWRHGALSYANVPLSVVRDAVERRYPVDMTLDDGLSGRSFSGMVRLTGDEKRDIPHFAALIGANWQHDGTRWTLSPKDSAAR